MTKKIAPPTKRPAWKALTTHYKNVFRLHLRKLFADDPKRGERVACEAVGLCLDYSKNRITDKTVLAEANTIMRLAVRRQQLFAIGWLVL